MINLQLQQLREARGWSQTQLAKKSGVSQTYISELELCKKQPTVPIVKKLATALDVSVVELINEPVDKAVGEWFVLMDPSIIKVIKKMGEENDPSAPKR